MWQGTTARGSKCSERPEGVIILCRAVCLALCECDQELSEVDLCLWMVVDGGGAVRCGAGQCSNVTGYVMCGVVVMWRRVRCGDFCGV